MALVATEHDPQARRRVMPVFLQHGVAGLVVLIAFTIARADDTVRIIGALGPSAATLIVLLFVYAFALALLKFPLTDQIYVSLVITAYISMFPLLGLVLSAWVAVTAAILQRLIAMLQIGPQKVDMRDPALERARTFALFSTYGVPVILATLTYEWLGGEIPQLQPTIGAALRMTAAAVVLIAANNLVVARVERAFGYSRLMSIKLTAIDSSIYLLTLPYAILMTFSYGSIGWGGVLAAAFTGVFANFVGRKLAQTRGDREQLIQRLASLTSIGETISLEGSTDDLLQKIYDECHKVIDTSIFSIALIDRETDELCFELNIEHGQPAPKTRIALGAGLNSWVSARGKPLLIASAKDEIELGVEPVDDGMATESWLGVPMIARERVIGVISVQSIEKNAFSRDDLVLLTAIANQAAVAIENARLYRDLEGLNLALEQRVAARTNELREANLRLISADHSKNQFLAGMSHELRTPLNAIIGFSTILLDTTRQHLPPRLYRFLENIKTAGSHLLDLINDILDLSKIESGMLKVDAENFDVRETIATVERVIKGVAAERDVTLVTRVDDGVGSVRLDEGRVKQILLNLLSNAVKFSHPGGYVQLSARALSGSDSPLGRETIRLEVVDGGIGIPADEKDRIFDEFYQVSGQNRPKGGSGLGLSLTRHFVELHGGRISVSSEPGRGTAFIVDLPRMVPSGEGHGVNVVRPSARMEN